MKPVLVKGGDILGVGAAGASVAGYIPQALSGGMGSAWRSQSPEWKVKDGL